MRQIDRASRVPPWQQIAACLRAEIAAGRYSPDGPALAAEGLIEVEPGMGYYVRKGSQTHQ